MEFSELALQKLLQLFPDLANFIVTFRDVTQDVPSLEGTNVNVGIFIMKIGQGYFYVPITAKGGSVQQIDSLFDVEKNSFFPLTSQYVQQLVNSSAINMGTGAKIPGTVDKNPSVYNLVTPPRTGKYVYASASRLIEFLAITPNFVKQAVSEAITNDKEIYSSLHKLFGLENVLAALKPTQTAAVVAAPKPAVEVITEGTGLENSVVKEILSKGYALRGENTTTRVAVLANDFSKMGKIKKLGMVDAGYSYDLIMKNGSTRACFIPKRSPATPQFAAILSGYHRSNHGEQVFALFSNGDYSMRAGTTNSEPYSSAETISSLFKYAPPGTPKDINNSDTFALFSPDLELLGVYNCWSTTLNSVGVTIQARNRFEGDGEDKVTINAFRNCTVVSGAGTKEMFIPYNTLVVKLGQRLDSDVEHHVGAAAAKMELSTLEVLGSAADIGFDGVEFSFNGNPVGGEHKIIEILVVKEGIAPQSASSFVKQAKEHQGRNVKIYLSKKADFDPGEIPEYGEKPGEQVNPLDLQQGGITQNLGNNLLNATQTGDPQLVENTLISELLQVANMKEYISEYLPDIENAIDRIGRALFLLRIRMEDLAVSHNANEITNFIANLRNVYKLLGSNYLKLKFMMAETESSEGAGTDRDTTNTA